MNRAPAAVVATSASVIGLGISTYLTVEHYAGNDSLACPADGAINCLKVTTSRWSEVIGVPVAVWGLAYFAVMAVVAALPDRDRRLRKARIAVAAVGVVSALYLVAIELFAVDAVCLWCTAVHLLTLIVFAAVAWPRRVVCELTSGGMDERS